LFFQKLKMKPCSWCKSGKRCFSFPSMMIPYKFSLKNGCKNIFLRIKIILLYLFGRWSTAWITTAQKNWLTPKSWLVHTCQTDVKKTVTAQIMD
jgi:hypothetical protein